MWKETTKEVIRAIMKAHKGQMEVFASYTDLDGDSYEYSSGTPEVVTEWGFRHAKKPLIRLYKWKDYEGEREWQHMYFIIEN